MSFDPQKCFKPAGLHLKQVTLAFCLTVFFLLFEYSDINIQCQTFDIAILESCGNEMFSAVLLLIVSWQGRATSPNNIRGCIQVPCLTVLRERKCV